MSFKRIFMFIIGFVLIMALVVYMVMVYLAHMDLMNYVIPAALIYCIGYNMLNDKD